MLTTCDTFQSIASLRRETAGSVVPIMAMSIMAIVSLGGAAIALGLDSRAASNLQMTADFAALSGATAFVSASSPRLEDRVHDAEESVAASVAANAGFAVRKLEIGAIVEDPYGQHAKIDVALAFQPANPAAKMAGRNAGIAIERRATASATWGFPLCVLGLNSSGTGFGLQDEASLTAQNCVVWTNAKSSQSMQLTGGTGTAKYFCAAGRAVATGAQMSPRPHEDCDPIPDPLESWEAPGAGIATALPVSSLAKTYNIPKMLTELSKVLDGPDLKDATKDIKSALQTGSPLPETAVAAFQAALDPVSGVLSGKKADKDLDADGYFLKGESAGLHVLEVAQIIGIIDNLPGALYAADTYANVPTLTLPPGTYAGLDIAAGHVRLTPGVYHIVGAPFTVRRRATLTAEGVTFVLHGDDATFSVTDEARVTLSAPEAGETAGFAIAENRRAVLMDKQVQRSRFTGSGRVNLIGTLYLPRQVLSISGDGAADQTSPLLQIVADTLDMRDTGMLKIVFDPDATKVPVTIMAAREARLDY